MSTDRITVWARLCVEKRKCNLGHEHPVLVCAPKFLGPVVGKREHNNGYEKRMTDLRKDAQGRTYHQHVTIDYNGNVYWIRDEDRARFWPRLPSNGIDIRSDK